MTADGEGADGESEKVRTVRPEGTRHQSTADCGREGTSVFIFGGSPQGRGCSGHYSVDDSCIVAVRHRGMKGNVDGDD